MLYKADANASPLIKDLQTSLNSYRRQRNFAPSTYVAEKIQLINSYMTTFKLSGCVLGLSGGIDSAVAAALVHAASEQPGSPIKHVELLALPVHSAAATAQDDAVSRAEDVSHSLGLPLHTVDLTSIHEQFVSLLEAQTGLEADPWTRGQIVSYLRTPALFSTASLLWANKTSSLVIGTTNRDEGAYLGYIGKAADAMVDLQLISDLHKSEVYKLAEFFELPDSVLEATPSGDMFDGRVDEEVFGAPYDFVELYLHWLTLNTQERHELSVNWSEEADDQFKIFARSLEGLHHFNAHKYLVGSPAVHLDILPATVPGGWVYHVWTAEGLR